MPVSRPVFLLAFANDSQGSLRLGEEQNAIRNELADLDQQGKIDFQSLGYATLPVVYRELNRYRQRVALFHYGGHSSKTGVNLNANAERAAQLASVLGQQQHLQLVFLNGCDNFSEVEAFFSAGIPAVIATTAEVDDMRAVALARQFYQGLAAGSTLYEAFEAARSYMHNAYEGLEVRSRALYRGEDQPDTFGWGLYYQHESALDWRIPGSPKRNGPKRPRLIAILGILLVGLIGFLVPWNNISISAASTPVLSHFPVLLSPPPTESIEEAPTPENTRPEERVQAEPDDNQQMIALPILMSGKVIDANTGDPIIGARISSHGVNTITDEDGEFSYHLTEYPPKPEVKIAVRADGYYEYNHRYYSYPKNDIKISLRPKY